MKPTNERRANQAVAALDAHARRTEAPYNVEHRIADLICDLAHLAEDKGLDPVRVIRDGLYDHAAERGAGPGEAYVVASMNPSYHSSPHRRLFRAKHNRLRGTLVAALVHWNATMNTDELPESEIEENAGGAADPWAVDTLLSLLGFDAEEHDAAVERFDEEANEQQRRMTAALDALDAPEALHDD